MDDLIGRPEKRTEDRRFITGRGRYLDDMARPGQLCAVFVRSPVAHGDIREIETDAAAEMEGVAAVFTAADIGEDLGPLPCGWAVAQADGSPMNAPAHPVLAGARVRYVGEPVAVVLAETKAAADAAADAVLVEIDDRPVVVDAARARDADAPLLHDDAPLNTAFRWELGDAETVTRAFEAAAHVTELGFHNNRLIPNAIETRAALAEYDAGSDFLTLYTTSQNPHLARLVLSAFVGLAPEHRLRVVSPDMGGGFGSKIFVYSEEAVVGWAARRLGRPVKWTASRSEAFLSDAHGRDHVTTAALALDADGQFLGLRVHTTANLGAYLSTFGSAVPTYLYGTLLAGQYRTPAIHVHVDGVFTNTAPVDAYRGAGRPEATYVVERLVEAAARETGIDPAEIRRRNFIRPADYPYETPVALVYDTGDYDAHLTRALEMADYAGFAARRRESEARGHRRGIGLSCYIEACGIAPSQLAGQLGAGVGLFDSARVRVNATGNVAVYAGVHSHGQGHETTFAQLVAGRLGLGIDEVDVIHGDTESVQYGLGTYGSRSLAVGGSAIVKALDKVIDKGRRIAAHLLESTPDEIDYEPGTFRARGSNRSVGFKDVAFAAHAPVNIPPGVIEPGLDETAFYDPVNFTYPSGSYVCEVEIDPETGVVTLDRFVAVDDFGAVINPMIVEGQVHGGLAQGIGQALLEGCRYDPETGQLMSGSYMDYTMPRADDLCRFALETTVTECTHNPLGAKGCGEAGAIGAPPAVINAVTDALGIRDIAMPATPFAVWTALRQQGDRNA